MLSISSINARLLTGGGTVESADLTTLKSLGVTDVIDCQENPDVTTAMTSAGINNLFNPTADDGNTKGSDWFKPALAFALNAISNPNRRVFSHCAGGVNRGPSMAYAILRALGWYGGEAKLRIHLVRPETLLGIRYADDADKAVVDLGYVPKDFGLS